MILNQQVLHILNPAIIYEYCPVLTQSPAGNLKDAFRQGFSACRRA
jgi:hypothetical protein